jgi:transposase
MNIEERREQVSKLVSLGNTNAQIAKELGVSSSTISADRKAIREAASSTSKKEPVVKEANEQQPKTSEKHDNDDTVRTESDLSDKYISRAKGIIEEARQQAHDALVPDEKPNTETGGPDTFEDAKPVQEDRTRYNHDEVKPSTKSKAIPDHSPYDYRSLETHATRTGFMVGLSVGLVSMFLVMLIFG